MTDFRNVKLKVLSREHSAAFQEAAFEAGVKWAGGKQEVRNTEARYLFISDDPEPVFTWDDKPYAFENSTRKEILFTTPAYLKTKIKIRDKEHFDFVVKKLAENGVAKTDKMRWEVFADGNYIAIDSKGSWSPVSKKKRHLISDHKEIFIEKDDTELDDTTKTIDKLVVDVEANITTRFTDTEASDGSTASYYELPDGATELQHLISHKDMNSQIGEIFRSCYRYGQASHSDRLRDAKKIQFYINAEIERLEKLNAK